MNFHELFNQSDCFYEKTKSKKEYILLVLNSNGLNFMIILLTESRIRWNRVNSLQICFHKRLVGMSDFVTKQDACFRYSVEKRIL